MGVLHCLQLIDFTANIELTDEEWDHPLLQKLIKIAAKSVLLTNDWFSLRKELMESENLKLCRNIIALYMALEKLTLQESIDKLYKFINETDNEILKIVDLLNNENNSKTIY